MLTDTLLGLSDFLPAGRKPKSLIQRPIYGPCPQLPTCLIHDAPNAGPKPTSIVQVGIDRSNPFLPSRTERIHGRPRPPLLQTRNLNSN
jgi:hypothetical protein